MEEDMRFQTKTGFVTVIIGKHSIKVDTRDARLDIFRRFFGQLQTIEGKKAHLVICGDPSKHRLVAGKLGEINNGPEQQDALELIPRFDKLCVDLPNGKTEIVTRPKHSLVLDILVHASIIVAPVITIRLKPTEETANWFGQQVIFPFAPPVEVEDKDTATCPQNAGIETVGQFTAPKVEQEPPSPIEGLTVRRVEMLIKRIDELELSVRIINVFHELGYEFVFQMVEHIHPGVGHRGHIGAHAWPKNFGRKCYNEFAEVMEALGGSYAIVGIV